MTLNIDNLKVDDIKMKDDSVPEVPVQKAEDKPENKVDQPEDKPPIDKPLEDKPADKPEDKPVDLPQDNGYTAEDLQIFSDLSSQTGVKVGSDDDVVNSLKELAGYRSGKIPGESAILTKAREIEKQGGNLTAFFRALSRDPEKMPDHDVLREAYLEKSERAKTNPTLAGKDFERDLRVKYGSWMTHEKMPARTVEEQQARQEFYEKNADEIDYQKELYADDVSQARKAFKDIQTSYPVEKKEGGMTQSQLDEIDRVHVKQSSEAFNAFKGLDLKLSGDNKFTIGLNEKTKPMVQGWASNPEKFLNFIGFTPDAIDYNRLVSMMAVIANFEESGFGDRIQKHVLAIKDINTLETDLDKNAKKIDRGQNPPDGSGDLLEQIAAGFEARQRK